MATSLVEISPKWVVDVVKSPRESMWTTLRSLESPPPDVTGQVRSIIGKFAQQEPEEEKKEDWRDLSRHIQGYGSIWNSLVQRIIDTHTSRYENERRHDNRMLQMTITALAHVGSENNPPDYALREVVRQTSVVLLKAGNYYFDR